MPYDRNVAAVRYVADLMSGFVYEYFAQTPPDTGGRALGLIEVGGDSDE